MSSMMARSLLIAFATAVMCAACGKDSTTSPSTTTEVPRGAQAFGGTLGVGSSQFYSFNVSQDGTTDVTLLSLRPVGALTTTLTTVVGLGLGTPSGTECG